jgi:hypothetical protein
MPATYEPIATTTVSGTSTTNVGFSSIPQTYTDLVLIYNGSVNYTNTYYVMYYNGDSTLTNYSNTGIGGFNTSVTSYTNGYIYLGFSGSASVPVNCIANIQNYTNTTTFKTGLMRFNNTNNETSAGVGLWRNTAAINSINIYSYYGGAFNSGSTFTLYGIKAA